METERATAMTTATTILLSSPAQYLLILAMIYPGCGTRPPRSPWPKVSDASEKFVNNVYLSTLLLSLLVTTLTYSDEVFSSNLGLLILPPFVQVLNALMVNNRTETYAKLRGSVGESKGDDE
jgi:hypothetical protein